jgi:DNA repair protein RadD
LRCLILARPTKSEMLFVQIIGRALRTAPGKDHALILDHSDTTQRLGFVTDIHHDRLDDGSKEAKKLEAGRGEENPAAEGMQAVRLPQERAYLPELRRMSLSR